MTKKEYFQGLTRAEIRQGARMSLDNAFSLLGEALLFEKKLKTPRYDRASVFYQLSIEETGKAGLLLMFHEEKSNGKNTDYSALSKAFTDHKKKQ